AALPAGSHPLTAELHDGDGAHIIELAPYDVPAADNLAPEVRIVSPGPDAIVASAESPTFDIVLSIADRDDDEVTVTVEARLGNQTFLVAEDEPVGQGTQTVTWDLTGLPEGVSYHLIAT